MKPTSEAHVAQQSPAVAEVAAGDGQTPFVIQDMLAGRWATATAIATSHASYGGQGSMTTPPRSLRSPRLGCAPPPPTG
ncbi:DUF6207 family protein [Streptomyces massasporeus]|uniref:DUF6207 family protein n=1 Tax=Streptomyces massasporeus TaxID=67324 RepID=UPI0033EE2254